MRAHIVFINILYTYTYTLACTIYCPHISPATTTCINVPPTPHRDYEVVNIQIEVVFVVGSAVEQKLFLMWNVLVLICLHLTSERTW